MNKLEPREEDFYVKAAYVILRETFPKRQWKMVDGMIYHRTKEATAKWSRFGKFFPIPDIDDVLSFADICGVFDHQISIKYEYPQVGIQMDELEVWSKYTEDAFLELAVQTWLNKEAVKTA